MTYHILNVRVVRYGQRLELLVGGRIVRHHTPNVLPNIELKHLNYRDKR